MSMFPGYIQPEKTPKTEIIDEDGECLTAQELEKKKIMKRQKELQQVDIQDRRIDQTKEQMTNRVMVVDESSSNDDDDPTVRMPKSLRVSKTDKRLVMNKVNSSHRLLKVADKNRKRKFTETEETKPDTYNSFPEIVVKQEIEDVGYDDIKETKPDISEINKKKKKQRRRRSRSRSRERLRFREKSYPKKGRKNRKSRYSSPSSSSSSSVSTSRSRSHSRSRNIWNRDDSRPKQYIQDNKWAFINEDELRNLHILSCHSWIISSRKPDSENAQLGMATREVPKYRLTFRFIDGLEKNDKENKFYKYFSTEFPQKSSKEVKEKPFHVALLNDSKHVPQENKFRKKIWLADYNHAIVPLSNEPLDLFEYQSEQSERRRARENLENEFRRNHNKSFDESIINAISDLEVRGQAMNIRVTQNPTNVSFWIEFIDLQDKIYETKRIHEICDSRMSHLERKEEILKEAIRKNPKHVQLYLMKMDLLMEMKKDPEMILSEFKTITHFFPHVPLVWNRYLDYIQYDNNVYNFQRMDSAFAMCLEKVRGLVDGTLQSHITFITNPLYMRKYQLFVYIRYLKWLMNCGCIPLAIANIQATFELNFGFPLHKIGLKSHRDRVDLVSKFWDTKLPRIGDRHARGALLEYKRAEGMSQKLIEQLEFEQYDIGLYNTRSEVKESLSRYDRKIANNWVNFERNMLNIEARVKRNPVKLYDAEYRDELEVFELWDPISSSQLRVYYHPPDETLFDFVQPLLELLGSKFSTTSNMWCTTEELLESWRCATPESNCNFDRIPTYTENFCRAFATNIIDYLVTIEYPHSDQKKTPLERVMRLLIASILTKSADMERNRKDETWKLTAKDLTEMLKEVLTPYGNIIEANPVVGKVLQLVAVQKYLEWYRVARIHMDEVRQEIERCKARKIATDLYIDKDDYKRLTKRIPKHVNDVLQEVAPLWVTGTSRIGEDVPLPNIQIHLFAILLRLNMVTTTDKKSSLIILGSQVLEVPLAQVKIEKPDLIRSALAPLIGGLVGREINQRSTMIDVLPRPSSLAKCLCIVLEFTTLSVGGNDKERVSNCAKKFVEELKEVDMSIEMNNRDGKMIIDQLLSCLTDVKERKILHLETYKYVLKTALAIFPEDVRYNRRYVDDMTTCTAKKIELQKNLNVLNKKFNELRRQRFEFETEINLKIVSIVTIYSSLKLFLKHREQSSMKSLLKIFRNQAEAMNDPTLWRLAMKFASNIPSNNFRDLNETHIMASGQCGWSRNIHIDRVDEQPTDDMMSYVMMLMGEKSRGSPHSMFVNDIRTVQSYFDIANQSRISKSREPTPID